MNDFQSAFCRRYADFNYRSPFGPQAMQLLSLGPNFASYDKEKNDVWSIGICVLVALINEDYNIFYNWTTQEIDFEMISQKLK